MSDKRLESVYSLSASALSEAAEIRPLSGSPESLRYHLLKSDLLKPGMPESGARTVLTEAPVYRLLLPQSGVFRIENRGRTRKLTPGSAFLLPPDEFAECVAPPASNGQDSASAVCLRFDFTAADLAEPEPLRCSGTLPGFADGEASVSPAAFEQADAAYTLRFARTGSARGRLQFAFGQLMSRLTGVQETASLPAEAGRAVADSLEELELRLDEDWTVARLAEAAGLPPRPYASAFRAVTGMAPLEYLAALRIERAGQMLRVGRSPLREVASRTGFRDEYYFSRRFRAATGSSPGRYARQTGGSLAMRDSLHRRVFVPAQPKRVLYLGEAVGDLLALGISPVGGLAAPSRQGFCGERLASFAELSSDLDLQGGASIRPDLIICTRMDEAYCREWSRVAPVLAHNSWDTLEERMRLLGIWFGKEQDSEHWLEHYFQAERRMWRGLNSEKRGRTASVFLFERGRFFVMGRIGLSALLYHPDGFRPAESLAGALRRGDGYLEISPEQAADYAADRIFLLTPSLPEERRMVEEFLQGPHWRRLRSQARHGVHIVESSHWNFVDAYSRSRMLGSLRELLDPPFGNGCESAPSCRQSRF